MRMNKNKISIVLITSALGVIALAVTQLIWMRHSWHLSEEIFNQRVQMALCSAVERYDGGMLCGADGACCSNGNTNDKFVAGTPYELQTQLVDNPEFRAELSRSLRFHEIDLDYQLSLSEEKQSCNAGNFYQSAVLLPDSEGHTHGAYVRLNFPDQGGFILESMNFMVMATVLILIFITSVLLLVTWSLVKQKRLLQTNVDFFNNMAHEFRTPLSNIGLAVNMLLKKHPELKDKALLDVIKRENTHLLSEVERVLHLARVDNGDYVLQKEIIPLKALLDETLNKLAMPIAENHAQVLIDAIPDTLEIYGDRRHLGSVFQNLLDNALKYSPAQPEIHITAQSTPHGVTVSVQDNGIGIPAEQRALIFEKFQRIQHGDQFAQKGFGLGLAYVKSMVELHKGIVRVFSEENKGSRFEVYLPAIA
jgi:two-component system, OmpR family, phosphate regulon sensor histidine kinase PhoR